MERKRTVVLMGDAEGRLQRRHLPLGVWEHPETVDLDSSGEALLITWGHGRSERKEEWLLERFLALAEARPERFEAFARRYGVLGLCAHGIPAVHSVWCVGGMGESTVERLEDWRRYARGFVAAIELAQALVTGGPTRADQWRPLLAAYWWVLQQEHAARLEDSPRSPSLLGENNPSTIAEEITAEVPRSPIEHQRHLLGCAVSDLIRIAGVHPMIAWSGLGEGEASNPAIQLGNHLSSAFGALAVQLAAQVCSARSVEQCSGCKTMYAPRRRASRGARRYCEACREEGVPMRDARRDYRARQRQARRSKEGA